MHRTLAAVAVLIAVSSAAPGPAHAGPAETIPAAQDFWDQFLNSDSLPAPTKKQPFHYGVFPYAAEACGFFDKKRVDKITTKQPWQRLSACLNAATIVDGTPEYTWEPSDVEMLLIGFDSKKQQKAIRKATKGLEIVALTVNGSEMPAAVNVFFAVDKKGNVRGVYMYVDSAN